MYGRGDKNVRHKIILFDVDDTLINLYESSATFQKLPTPTGTIIWNGGRPNDQQHTNGLTVWQKQITALKTYAFQKNIVLHFGIATSKKRMDALLGAVVESEFMQSMYSYVKGLGPNLGLACHLDADLIFMTFGRCKINHALVPALEVINDRLNLAKKLKPEDLFLIDDIAQTCTSAKKAGYNAINAENLSKLPTAEQVTEIEKIFLKLQHAIDLACVAQNEHSVDENDKHEISKLHAYISQNVACSGIAKLDVQKINALNKLGIFKPNIPPGRQSMSSTTEAVCQPR